MSTTTIGSLNFSHFDLNTKKVKNFSIIISVVCHLSIIIIVKYGNIFSATTPVTAAEENYIDLGYQVLNEVPEIRQVTTKSEEIQDETSQVSSLQKEKSTPTSTQSSAPTYTDVPYYKIKPKYPKDALESGVEGNVKMSIDILEDGTVENIKVTGGEKVGTFESAATRSVAKWKYKPFTDQTGKVLKKKNYLVQVDFKIKDETISQ